MSQVEWGMQSLYEAPELRDELTDEEGRELLEWGRTQVERLAAQGLNDLDFEEQLGQLKRLLRRMNRLAGRRMNMDPVEAQKAIDRVADSAAAVGLPVAAQRMQGYLAQPVSQAAGADVGAVIRLVSPPDPPTTAATDPPVTDTPDPIPTDPTNNEDNL